jgi:hypothetical protein
VDERGTIVSQDKDDERMRKQCRKGTQAYSTALTQAGYFITPDGRIERHDAGRGTLGKLGDAS